MLIHTEDTAKKTAPFEKREKYREQLQQWIARETQYAMYLEDETAGYADPEKRLGKPLTTEKLEEKLKKVNPNLVFEFNQFNSSKKAAYLVDRRGKRFICAYENMVMPERSIMRVNVKEVPEDVTHIDRKDLGPVELVPGRGFVPKSGSNPYIRKVREPFGEAIRGWRTVLIKLVGEGAATPTQIESVFGPDNTKEWQSHLGKAKVVLPW
jgi:hypothetical protein